MPHNHPVTGADPVPGDITTPAPPNGGGISSRDQDDVMDAYLNAFYTETAGVGNFFLNNVTRDYPQPVDFWRMAEEIEMVEDACDRTRRADYQTIVEQLYAGFVKVNGTDWTGNIYNDDLMWINIVCLRAYRITGNRDYLNQAKRHFDSVWKRAYDPADGGVWWTTENTSKNACISGPTAIAAALLFQCGMGDEYLEHAREVFDWEVRTLYRPDGQVSDHITAGGIVRGGALSYNQGTFIGAAHLLNLATGTNDYDEYAVTTASYTREHCTGENAPLILRNEYQEGQGGGDNAGFKGIFARWCGLWARESGHTELLPWLRLNAQTVYDNRNAAGLSWGFWGRPTPNSVVTAWECSGAVSMIQNVPPSGGETGAP